MILVLAGTYREFGQFCFDELDMAYKVAESRRFAKYISGTYAIHGYSNFQFVKYGTWYNRPDRFDILELIRYLRTVRAPVKVDEQLDEQLCGLCNHSIHSHDTTGRCSYCFMAGEGVCYT